MDVEPLERCHGPRGEGCRQGLKALISNLVAFEVEYLRIAHQTKRLGQGSAHAKRQGQRLGQWGASSPATAPVRHWHRSWLEPLRRRRRSGCSRVEVSVQQMHRTLNGVRESGECKCKALMGWKGARGV